MTWNSEHNKGRWGELEDFYHYQLNENNNMNGIFQLSWVNVKSALVYGILAGVVSMIIYATTIGDVFALNSHALVNAGVFGFFGAITSLLKNLLTTDSGNFLGITTVIPENKV